MKSIIGITLMAIGVSSIKIEGIPKDDIMQNQPNHWRKIWPEGEIDDSTGDAEVLNMFSLPEPPKEPEKKETYPYTIDEDVITTQASIKTAEKLTKSKLTDDGAKNSGMDMLMEYDNMKRVWERNTPYGNDWHEWDWTKDKGMRRAADPSASGAAVTIAAPSINIMK